LAFYRDCLNQALREHSLPGVDETVLRNHHHGFIEDSIVEGLVESGYSYDTDKQALIFERFYELDEWQAHTEIVASLTDVKI